MNESFIYGRADKIEPFEMTILKISSLHTLQDGYFKNGARSQYDNFIATSIRSQG